MDNIIQIERLLYRKICDERTTFNDLINNCLGKSENLKQQGPLCVILLHCFFFQKQHPKLFSKVTVLKFRTFPLELPAVDFCFSCRAQIFISTEIELRSMLPSEFSSSYFSKYLWLIAVTKSSHQRWSIKRLFLETLQYSHETTFVGVSF